jgi:hypothetical protein
MRSHFKPAGLRCDDCGQPAGWDALVHCGPCRGAPPSAQVVDAGIYGGDPAMRARWISFIFGMVQTLVTQLSLDEMDRLDCVLITEMHRRRKRPARRARPGA